MKSLLMLIVVHCFPFCRFNIQDKVSQTTGSNLKSMWSGPWKRWKDVPSNHREHLFECFQMYTYDTFVYDNAYDLIKNKYITTKCFYVAILSMER
ncbi:hypothetical protein Hanom_Chr03g00216091 [Helianthus anomalus]